jgi:hypothetical protein
MSTDIKEPSRDWLRSPRTSTLAWWLPSAAIAAGLLAPVPIRTVVWIAALVCMGTACLLNARRCGRIHCRYTGPYYLAMIVPVGVLGSGLVPVGIYAWLLLACVILLGSKLIWWATERAWGEFSR